MGRRIRTRLYFIAAAPNTALRANSNMLPLDFQTEMEDLSRKEVSCDIQASPYYERMKDTSKIRNYQESMVKTKKVCTRKVRCIEFLEGLEKRHRVNRTEN